MFYLIYKITNNINNKIYIGSHKTKNKDDGYMGSGKYLNRAIDKHGIENFTKEILFVFDNPKEMYDKEAEIVDDDFLAEENTYNLKRGGFGGFDYINANNLQGFKDTTLAGECQKITQKIVEEKYTKEQRREWAILGGQKSVSDGKGIHALSTEEKKTIAELGRLATLTDSARLKRKTTFSTMGHQQGAKNSQYNTCWITKDYVNRKIKKADIDFFVSAGWALGRKIAKK